MSKRHSVTLHHVITVYDDMFDHTDGLIRALAKKKTRWKEDLLFAVKLARQKLSKYHTEETMDGHVSHFCTHPPTFLEVAMV